MQLPELPAKRMFGNLSSKVVAGRKHGLSVFLNNCVKHFATDVLLVAFLSTDSERLRVVLEEEQGVRREGRNTSLATTEKDVLELML